MSDSARDLLGALDGLAAPDLWDEIASVGRGVAPLVGDVSGNGVSASVGSGLQRRVFETSGLELSYLAVDGFETPIVFVHGMTSAAATWGPVMERLDRGAMYALDLRGHGQSARSAEYSLQADAGDVVAFLEEVSGPAVLVAHSRGALVAFLATFKRPDLVLGMFSEDMTPALF